MPKKTVQEFLSFAKDERGLPWILEALQGAVELEHSTIPPYLCGWFTINSANGGDPSNVSSLIHSIVIEEMLHMGLASNILTSLGGPPGIDDPQFVPTYPGPLPMGVRPGLIVPLTGLTRDVVRDVFMQIEYPEYLNEKNKAVTLAAQFDQTYPTIGNFYDAILEELQKLPDSAWTGKNQITDQGMGLFAVNNFDDAQKAITLIKVQGEGTPGNPEGTSSSGSLELAHYYTFAEIYVGKTLSQDPTTGEWSFGDPPIPFPNTYPMATVPKEGYPDNQDVYNFNVIYTNILVNLHNAWNGGGSSDLSTAISLMFRLPSIATKIVQTPLPSGKGNYGPSFQYVKPTQVSTGNPTGFVGAELFPDYLALKVDFGDVPGGVRYTTDGWKTWKEVVGIDSSEKTFNLPLFKGVLKVTFEFAAFSPASQVWDNNGGKNYKLHVLNGGLRLE